MADTTSAPGTGTGEQGAEGAEDEQPRWGRALDAAGVVAGVILVAIVIDIWTDGRLISRRLGRRGGDDDDQEPVPAETEP